jgi:hypothetical protein
MEPGGSLPHSQGPATCPCPEPAQSCKIKMNKKDKVDYDHDAATPADDDNDDNNKTGRVVEGNFHGLIYGTVLSFVWRTEETHRNF